MSELWRLTATELLGLQARKAVSAAEICAAFQRRVAAVNPALNALVVPLWDSAALTASRVDAARAAGETLGPLAGIPVSVKECYDLAGTATTVGLPSRTAAISSTDAATVAALRAADALLIGKTNVPQLLLFHETDNPLFGRTNNPWDVNRSCGGSSGGEAALIAAGGSPCGLGSDLGGSIRQPAHSCGIHGLKPTSGRLDQRGMFLGFRGLGAIRAVPGPMARSVADLDLLMRIWHGAADHAQSAQVKSKQTKAAPTVDHHRNGAARWPLPLAWPDYRAVQLRGLRIAFWEDDGYFPVAPAIRRLVRTAAQRLAAEGAELIPWQPPRIDDAMDLYFQLLSADGGADIRALVAENPLDERLQRLLNLARLPPPFRWLLHRWEEFQGNVRTANLLRASGKQTAAEFWRTTQLQHDYSRDFWAAFSAVQADAFLCPPHALPALTHGASDRLAVAGSACYLANLLDCPAGVVCLDRIGADQETDRAVGRDISDISAREVETGSLGLPIGVQIGAPPWREDRVLAIMAALTELFPSLNIPELSSVIAGKW